MKFVIYGICPETRRGKFLCVMDAETEHELENLLGVAHFPKFVVDHPTAPGVKIYWKGNFGIAAPERGQVEKKIPTSVALTESEITQAKLLGGGNLSEGIRRALLLAVADGG